MLKALRGFQAGAVLCLACLDALRETRCSSHLSRSKAGGDGVCLCFEPRLYILNQGCPWFRNTVLFSIAMCVKGEVVA